MKTINNEIHPDTSEKKVESLQSAENATLPRAIPDKVQEIWKDNDVLNSLLHSRSELDETSGEYKNIAKRINFMERVLQRSNRLSEYLQRHSNRIHTV